MTKEELVSYLIRMHQIINLPEYNNAMIVGQYLMDIVREHKLSEIEQVLREIKSRVYLIGLPLSFYESPYKLVSKLPDTDKEFKYALWVEVNGQKKLEELIERNKLSDVDKPLTETGFLCLKRD